MITLKTYTSNMQQSIEACFRSCLEALGWEYQPCGRHSDIINIADTYMTGTGMCRGCFWCLIDDEALVGMVAVRCIYPVLRVAEMKRLYVLPEYQGKGYGGMLFLHAIQYAKTKGYSLLRVDTRHDRLAAIHLIEKYRFRRCDKYNDNAFAEVFFELDLK